MKSLSTFVVIIVYTLITGCEMPKKIYAIDEYGELIDVTSLI